MAPKNSSGLGRSQDEPTPPLSRDRRVVPVGSGAAVAGVRQAQELALCQFIAWRGGYITLDADTYRELAGHGLSRTDVHRAIDALVHEDAAKLGARSGCMRIEIFDWVPQDSEAST